MSMRDAEIDESKSFERFFQENEPKLRRALVAGYGGEVGRDATAEALTHGWQEWYRVSTMDNPSGYLYRVGDRWARRQVRRRHVAMTEPTSSIPNMEPGLATALDGLTARQRQVVALVVGFGFTHIETADLLGISRSSVQNHVERGMKKLRQHLGAPL